MLVACIVAALVGWGAGRLWNEGVAPGNPAGPGAGGPAGPLAVSPATGSPGVETVLGLQTVLAAEPRIHVVQRGETLYRIARRYDVSVDELARYNGLDDPAHIEAGQRLRIPPAAGIEPGGGTTANTGAGQPGARAGEPPGASGSSAGTRAGPESPSPAGAGSGAGGAGSAGGGEAEARQSEDPGAGAAGRAGPAGGDGGTVARGGVLALTFNDGPDPDTWPALLQVLDQHGVKATFFLEGARAQQHPQLVQELARRGHQVENHGWSHRSPQELGEAATRAEIRRTAALLARLTGRPPLYYRPAGDLRDRTVFAWAREEGHRILLWTNIGAQDVPPLPPEQLAARVAASAYNGAVLMLHATQPATVQALPGILQRLEARHLRPVTVDQLLQALQAAGPGGEAEPPNASGTTAGGAEPPAAADTG